MEDLSERINDLLVEVYRSITEIEARMVKSSGSLDLSINEIHLLGAVAKRDAGEPAEAKTISDLSDSMGISLPSVTVAINKLVKKGYVEKAKCPTDGRVVHVTLTKRGEKVDRAHTYFHRKMVASIISEMNEEEERVLMGGLLKLGTFLDRKLTQAQTSRKGD